MPRRNRLPQLYNRLSTPETPQTPSSRYHHLPSVAVDRLLIISTASYNATITNRRATIKFRLTTNPTAVALPTPTPIPPTTQTPPPYLIVVANPYAARHHSCHQPQPCWTVAATPNPELHYHRESERVEKQLLESSPLD